MLFPSISMAVIGYTCFTSVIYKAAIQKGEVPYYGVLHYFYTQFIYLILRRPTFKMSPTRPACTCLQAGTGLCTSFYSRSLAVEVSQNKTTIKPSFLL